MKLFRRDTPTNDVPRRRSVSLAEDEAPLRPASPYRRGQTLSSLRFERTAEAGDSHRHRLHHLSHRRRKAGGLLLLVVAISLVIAIVIFQLTARVGVAGSTTALSKPPKVDEYITRIDEYYAVHPVERLRFMLNEPALTEFVSAKYPEIEAVSLSRVREIVEGQFTFTFREPVAGWQINNRQYYVDKDGVVFENNYFADPTVQMIDESGFSPEQGSAVASSRLLSFVGTIVAGAGEKGYKVTSVSLPAGSTRQLEVRLEKVRPLIRMTIDREARGQVIDMDRSIRHIQSRKVTADYIDVRVEGRAVYR